MKAVCIDYMKGEKMMNKEKKHPGRAIKYKGFDILHSHVFNDVFFTAWKNGMKVWRKEIKVDKRDINWKDPLSKEDMDWLIKGELR